MIHHPPPLSPHLPHPWQAKYMLGLDQQWEGMGGVLLLSLANIRSNLRFYVILLYVMNTNLDRIPKQTR